MHASKGHSLQATSQHADHQVSLILVHACLQVSPGPTPVTSTPITPINVSGSVVPSHKAATVPPSKPPLSPVADPSATPTPRLATTSNAAARTVASYPSTPASTAQTPKVMTPPRHSTTSLGTLVSEHRQRRSVSAKKPPLHPPLSPSVLPSPPAQPITGNQSRSPPTMTQEPLGKLSITFALPLCGYAHTN